MASPVTVRRFVVAAVLIGTAATVGGCSGGSLSSFDPRDLLPDLGSGSGSSSGSGLGFTVFRGTPDTPRLRPVTAADYVGADGRCEAGAPAEAAAPATPVGSSPAAAASASTAPVAPALRGIGLTMTECEVVGIAGTPELVNVGVNETGARKVVLTYNKGDHAGIYTFVSGRLKVIDQLPTPPKPEPRKRAPKKRRA